MPHQHAIMVCTHVDVGPLNTQTHKQADKESGRRVSHQLYICMRRVQTHGQGGGDDAFIWNV